MRVCTQGVYAQGEKAGSMHASVIQLCVCKRVCTQGVYAQGEKAGSMFASVVRGSMEGSNGQCDLECGPKVIHWRGLRAGPGDHPGRGAPRV